MHTSENWINVVTSNVVYAGITDRVEFDQIALPAVDHGVSNPDRCVLTKTESGSRNGVMVVFQHWYGPTPAERAADAAVARARAQAALVLDTPQVEGA